MIELVVFDLDGTLVDTYKAVEKAREENVTLKILREEGHEVEKEELERALKSTERRINQHKGSERFKPGLFNLILSEELGNDVTEEKASRMDEKFFDKLLDILELTPGAKEILEYLKEKDIQLFLLSNSREKVMKKKINKFDLNKYFDEMFSSESAGTVKSGHEPFKKLLKETEIPPENILVVGNNPKEDALAKKFGMQTALLYDYLESSGKGEQFEPDYGLDSLMDIKDIIESQD